MHCLNFTARGCTFFSFSFSSLSEAETKTTLNIFSDHTGLVVDPFGVGLIEQSINPVSATPELRGVRLSPRQSPIYQPIVSRINGAMHTSLMEFPSIFQPLYGPTYIVYPSQAIHTTWWQFEYEP